MNLATCETIRDRIPDVAAGRVSLAPGGRAHLDGCADCRAELELAELLYASRPSAPAGTEARVMEAVRRRRRVVQRPWWGISAAAAAALALGIGITSTPATDGGLDALPDYAAEEEDVGPWLSDDGLLAGAPALDVLTDEALLELLDELSAGGAGGAV